MSKNNISDERLVYHMIEAAYIKKMGREIDLKDGYKNMDLYPMGWFLNDNYKKKAKILAEAVEKGCLIKDTEGYLDIIEGVKHIENDENNKK